MEYTDKRLSRSREQKDPRKLIACLEPAWLRQHISYGANSCLWIASKDISARKETKEFFDLSRRDVNIVFLHMICWASWGEGTKYEKGTGDD